MPLGLKWIRICCFLLTLVHGSDECDVDSKARIECGWAGITKEQCEHGGCCFSDHVADTFWCFAGRTQRSKSWTLSHICQPVSMRSYLLESSFAQNRL